MYYTVLRVACHPDFAEMIIAELSEIGFDTFMETEDGVEGYADGENYDRAALASIKEKYSSLTPLTFLFDQIEKKNWNEEWEKNYEPVNVEGRCLIRAEFHKPERKFEYDVIITPRMSFGTGHHQTTYLMIKNQLDMDHRGKRVMDAGCGTAILSVMACKLAAREVEAFDIDEWSVINGKENIAINGCGNISLRQGKITDVELSGTFDIILANINKNVLLDEIAIYAGYLNPDGLLLLSGFYESDADDLLDEAGRSGFVEVRRDAKEHWASLLLKKEHDAE